MHSYILIQTSNELFDIRMHYLEISICLFCWFENIIQVMFYQGEKVKKEVFFSFLGLNKVIKNIPLRFDKDQYYYEK